jgi:DNA-directed RNA polymerase subunit alpha
MNFIHYKDNAPINMNNISFFCKAKENPEGIVFKHNGEGKYLLFQLDTEEERDKVYNYLKEKYSTDIEAEMKEGEEFNTYTPIEILELTPRTFNALWNADIRCVEQIRQRSIEELRFIRGFGKNSESQVIEALERKGLYLRRIN